MIDAFAYTYELHKGQVRKRTHVPYITHLMAVSAIVGEYGGTEDQVIAGLLHDAMEDQGGRATLEKIRTRFGDIIADYVDGCSDAEGEPKAPWMERKQTFIDAAKTADPDLRLIIAADKIHNGRSILKDLRVYGNDLWGIFNGGRDLTLWYFDEVLEALSTGWEHPILSELTDVVARIKGTAESLKE